MIAFAFILIFLAGGFLAKWPMGEWIYCAMTTTSGTKIQPGSRLTSGSMGDRRWPAGWLLINCVVHNSEAKRFWNEQQE